jgi:peptidoglycan/xylan/chitin deacetylase (PgdA/CDA1 family)
MRKVTVIMYHYVRPIKCSRFPGIKGLELDLFCRQIDYLVREYNVISMEELLAAAASDYILPERAVLLTFDDAYLDHFLYVYPVLKKHRIQGSFFTPVRVVKEDHVLPVNKIHFVLEKFSSDSSKVQELLTQIRSMFEEKRKGFSVDDFESYYNSLAFPSRFDSGEVAFVKRFLQSSLPPSLRNTIIDKLFVHHVGLPEDQFRNELYMNIDHIKHMIADGMYFGAHGYNHLRWSELDSIDARNEIRDSIDFLVETGMKRDLITACYPYGAYNQQTINILKNEGVGFAFANEARVADLDTDNRLSFPRLDTNDILFQ